MDDNCLENIGASLDRGRDEIRMNTTVFGVIE
jgi:hypothetical protein